MSIMFKRFAIASLLCLLPGCVLPGDFYLVAEGGYQMVEISESTPEGAMSDEDIMGGNVFEGDGIIYGGGIGYGISLLKLYVGGEANISYSSFDEDVMSEQMGINDNTNISEMASAVTQIEESWVLNAVVDGGFYLTSDILIFGRAGYVYVDAETKVQEIDAAGNVVEDPPDAGDVAEKLLRSASDAFDTDKASAFAIGGGLEYEIGLGLGVRGVYLYQDGDRKAHDVRAGVVWRF